MPDTFGGLVRAERLRRDLTLAQVGELVGVDHPRLSRIERGLARPTAAEVNGLVRALDLDPKRALELAAAVVPPRDHDDPSDLLPPGNDLLPDGPAPIAEAS
jgi:transcriptional regulator with XRE-family HTH domain